VDTVLGPIESASAAVQKEMNAIQRGTQAIMNETILRPLALAGNLQALVETPLLAINDVRTRLAAYADLATEMSGIRPNDDGSQTNSRGRNTALVQQIAMTSTITANAKIVGRTLPAVSGITTRAQAVQAADDIAVQLDAIVTNLDQSQALFEDKPIDEQHFSQEQSHYDTMLLTTQAMEFMLISSFDLRIERRFTLDRRRAPVEIAIVEYQGPGEHDENIDLFIESNELHGEDILTLPSGREVVIYG
jgi:hypothetical protein